MVEKSNNSLLLEVKNLSKRYPIYGGLLSSVSGYVNAVDNISFDLHENETLGIVGESGCGKSTLLNTIMRLIPASEGNIMFNGMDWLKLKQREVSKARKNMQIIFQDPYASLDPRMTVGEIISEPLVVHKMGSKPEIKEQVLELLHLVGLEKSYYERHPHEFSGGQRQRISIARALALKPKLILCDEPVSALDLSIQSQILNLIMDLQEKFDLTYIFISHALNVVKHVSNRIGVMYLGNLVEIASVKNIFESPQHPYTKALLSSIPIPNPAARKNRIILNGDIPSPENLPTGCSFHTRCTYCVDICKTEKPKLVIDNNGSGVACHLKR